MTHDESESSMKMNSEKNKNKLTLDTTDLGAGNRLNDTLICGPTDGGPGGAVIDVTQLPQEHALLETVTISSFVIISSKQPGGF